MNSIQLHKKVFETPSTWNELTAEMLLYISSQWYGWRRVLSSKQVGIEARRKKTMQQAKILLLAQLMKINLLKKLSYETRLFYKIHPVQMLDLLKTTDFIFNNNTLTVNMFPVIDGLYGPPNELKGVTIGEFASAEVNYLNFHKSGNPVYLNKLCAVLYRDGSEMNAVNNDLRDEFNDKHIEYLITKTAAWKSEMKHAVLLFYMGCRNKIVADRKNIFENKGTGKKQNWAILILEMAGGKFGTVEQTYKQSLGTILTYLEYVKNKPAVK